jgi:hypothetical protein
LHADNEPFADRAQHLIEALDAGPVAQIEQSVDLGSLPIETALQFRLGHATSAHRAIKLYLCHNKRRETDCPPIRLRRWRRRREADLAAWANFDHLPVGSGWRRDIVMVGNPRSERLLDRTDRTLHRILGVVSEGRYLR